MYWKYALKIIEDYLYTIIHNFYDLSLSNSTGEILSGK